jgi:hypothetical protein
MIYLQKNHEEAREMENKLTITVTITNSEGEVIATKGSERAVPYIKEVEERGFRSAFHDIETALLESRKEVSDAALSSYLETMSLKKPNLSQC